jgi:hypothetical protein
MFFYLILLLASVFGSMLGINRKKTNNWYEQKTLFLFVF